MAIVLVRGQSADKRAGVADVVLREALRIPDGGETAIRMNGFMMSALNFCYRRPDS